MKIIEFGVFLDADSESPQMTKEKSASLESCGQKLFWSCDRLVKHEFDCLGLRIGLGLWSGL